MGGLEMMSRHRWGVLVLIIIGLSLSACQQRVSTPPAQHPAEVLPIEGAEVSRIVLTEQAIQRIGLKTDQVRFVQADGTKQLAVPYSALIYDIKGGTWVYTNPEPRTFVRQRVEVDDIEGDVAFLEEGPPVGTVVVSVGVAELYGTEFKVGH